MKKRICFITLMLCTLAVFTLTVLGAVPMLSPTLNNISADMLMTVSASKGYDVTFTPEDFEMALGSTPEQIKITALPEKCDGKLMLGNTEIFDGQTISRGNLNLLRFIPGENVNSSSFEFTSKNGYRSTCIMKITDKVNHAPVVTSPAAVCTVTQADITCFGTLYGYDPDGDSFSFEIVSYPSKGILTLTDAKTGNFTYTPYEGVTGADSFSYRLKDEYGEYSDKCTVNASITERTTDVMLSDMDGHWAHNAALSAVADGSMEVISENGRLYFDPDEVMTREEYLKAVMTALGADELPDLKSVFADDDRITEGYGGYVTAAYKLGIIKGHELNGKLYFNPQESISRAEASVIMNRILGCANEGALPAFNDDSEIPVWAQNDMRALYKAGIISGSGRMLSPLAAVSRAQTAQMIYAAKNLYM